MTSLPVAAARVVVLEQVPPGPHVLDLIAQGEAHPDLAITWPKLVADCPFGDHVHVHTMFEPGPWLRKAPCCWQDYQIQVARTPVNIPQKIPAPPPPPAPASPCDCGSPACTRAAPGYCAPARCYCAGHPWYQPLPPLTHPEMP